MKTKTKRIINAVFWAVLSIAITIYVCIVWHNMGCGLYSLIAAIVWYIIAPFAIGYTIDSCICGR